MVKWKQQLKSLKPYASRIAAAALVMVIFWTIASYYNRKVLKNMVKTDSKSTSEIRRTNLIAYQLANLVYYLLLIAGASFSFSLLGISNTTLLVFLGSVGLAFSMSTQRYLSTWIAGMQITINQLYNIGDHVHLIGNLVNRNVIGTVVDFDLLRTTILNEDGKRISVGNDEIIGMQIVLLHKIPYNKQITPTPR